MSPAARRRVAAIALSALAAAPAAAAPDACPALNRDLLAHDSLSEIVLRVGPDGDTEFQDTRLPISDVKLFGGKFDLRKLVLDPSAKATLVSGPPNMDLPFHATPYREMFLVLAGGSEIRLASGARRTAGPGTLILMDDMGARHGHAGRTGPCGYVSLSLARRP